MKLHEKIYRKSLIALLGFTRLLSKADFSVPSKWLAVFENIRISSDILYVKLSSIDEEAEEKILRKEDIIAKKLGQDKFYSLEELEHIKDNREDVEIQIPKF